jgi:hypothetical protein
MRWDPVQVAHLLHPARGSGHGQHTMERHLTELVIRSAFTPGDIMTINFRHDVDQVVKEAKDQEKPVLLDFSAAPM